MKIIKIKNGYRYDPENEEERVANIDLMMALIDVAAEQGNLSAN